MPGPIKRIKKLVRAWYYPRLHRSLFDDRRFAENNEALERKVRGRSVALVGNAQSLFDRLDGEAIDACDIVVRMNRGFVREPRSQGRRTDVFCLSTQSVTLKVVREEFGKASIVYCNRDRWVMTWDLWFRRRSLAFFPIAAWEDLSERLGGARPSTGMMALDFLHGRLGAAEIRLFGFDWKATKTFYSPELSLNVHDWAGERRLIEHMARGGRVRLPPGATCRD